MIKKVSTALMILLMGYSQIMAIAAYRLEDFGSTDTKASLSMVTYKGNSFAKVGLSPTFELGPMGIGLDFNLYVPLGDAGVPPEFQFVTLRSLYYDNQDNWGFKYGRLTNIQYGYGLLVDQYDSGSASTAEYNTSKGGLEAYAVVNPVSVDALYTATNVRAMRIAYNVAEDVVFGKPLVLGMTYAEDTDGIPDPHIATHNVIPAQAGYGIDASVPIMGDTLKVYTEYARLRGHKGQGTSLGIGGKMISSLRYKLELRSLGADFIPGYFNNLYEASSTTNSFPSSSIYGVLGSISYSLFDDYIQTQLMVEKYQSKMPLVSIALGWHKIGPVYGVINYLKSFQNPDGGRVNANIYYQDFPALPIPCDADIGIQRDYVNFGDPSAYSETITIGIHPKLDKMIPGFIL